MNINIDKIFNNSNLTWLKNSTFYLTLHGSYAYGTSRPDSDLDIRGIAIPPKDYYLGVLNNFQQAEFSDPYDCVIFDLRKFIKLCIDCNPNAIELLYTSEEDHLYKKDQIFNKLYNIRDAFLSKRARFTFAGYARSQLLRIKRHRKWIINPPNKKPERSDFGLPDNKKLIPSHKLQEINAQIEKKINEWNIDTTGLDQSDRIDIKNKVYDILIDLKVNQDEFHIYAARSIGIDDNLLESFKKEKAYADAVKNYKSFIKWKEERNKVRYELEEKYHYDVKHGMHLVRLYKQCIELLESGKLVVKRPDAEELLEIRNGAWTYDELISWADEQDKKIEDLYKISSLSKEPDKTLINNTCIDMICSIYEIF